VSFFCLIAIRTKQAGSGIKNKGEQSSMPSQGAIINERHATQRTIRVSKQRAGGIEFFN
jgi:hypothetical protein